ncbi:unnamed protein product, partial [Ectocarpus fasciculatus]
LQRSHGQHHAAAVVEGVDVRSHQAGDRPNKMRTERTFFVLIRPATPCSVSGSARVIQRFPGFPIQIWCTLCVWLNWCCHDVSEQGRYPLSGGGTCHPAVDWSRACPLGQSSAGNVVRVEMLEARVSRMKSWCLRATMPVS